MVEVVTPPEVRVARHYAAAAGLRWRRIRGEVTAYLRLFLEEMHGDDDERVARACSVIDAAIAESPGRPPTLRFIFHTEIFWRRLHDLEPPPGEVLWRRARQIEPNGDEPKRQVRRLELVAARAVPWLEPPECHDESCGACDECTKRAPFSRALFRDVRAGARRSAGGLEAFRDEVAESRERQLAARRADQLRRAEEARL